LTAWLLVGLSLFLILICGLFVAGEFALLTADRPAVERAAARGDQRSRGVLEALQTLSTQLSGVQIAITLTNLAIGFLAEPAIAGLLHAPLSAIGLRGEAVAAVAVVVALVLSTAFTMVLGELVPKSLAIAMPLAVARAVQRPVRAFTRVMRLPIRFLNGLANAILGLFGLEAQEELSSARSAEELASVVRHSAAEGTLGPRTATLLMRSLNFGDKRARDVLTPRPQMVTVSDGSTVADVLTLARRSGHSRFPVTGPAGLDDVVGVVDLRRAIAVPAPDRGQTAATDVMDRVLELPESLDLQDVLRELQASGSRLALIVDEYGGTAGLLTGEDILEELVGDVQDEHDRATAAVLKVAAGWEVSGLLRPDEVAAQTGLQLPDQSDYETIAGLVMHRLGRIPEVGDRVEVGAVELTVSRMDGRRIDRLLLTDTVPESDDGARRG
jgi:CBS domain containing-hemolysin-like protein